jgi:hypothetical protein
MAPSVGWRLLTLYLSLEVHRRISRGAHNHGFLTKITE